MAIRLSDQIVRRLSIGSPTLVDNQPNASYLLYVGGTTRIDGVTTHNDNIVPVASNTIKIGLHSSSIKYVYSNGISVNDAASNSAGGISLYSDEVQITNYGIAMRAGSKYGWIWNDGTNNGVDWNINFYNTGNVNRGWKFIHSGNAIASLNGQGDFALKGALSAQDGHSYISPKGGMLQLDSSSYTGYLKIELPPTSYLATMLSFDVVIDNYVTSKAATYHIYGYCYNGSSKGSWAGAFSAWSDGEAGYDNGAASLSVRAWYAGGKYIIAIGEPTTTWSYPRFYIQNFNVGFGNWASDEWKRPWKLSIDTAAFPTSVDYIRTDPQGKRVKTVETLGNSDYLVYYSSATGTAPTSTTLGYDTDFRYNPNTNTLKTVAGALNINGFTGLNLNNNGKPVVIGSTTAAENDNNLLTLRGHMVIDPSYNTSNSYSEGLRINLGSNSWSTIALGGAAGSKLSTGDGIWLIGVNSKKLYLSHNGSNNAATRFQGSSTGFIVYPRIGVNGENTTYNFYTNGTSYFNGNATHNGNVYFANGTTYYINNNADAVLRRGIFAGTSTADTADGSLYNTGALEIREAGRVGTASEHFRVAPRIGFHWSGRIAASLSFHKDGWFYFRKQNGTDRAIADVAATRVLDSNNNSNHISITYSKAGQASTSWLASWNGYELGAISPANVTAGNATKLATARTITISNYGVGSFTFDGSADKTVDITPYYCYATNGNTANYPWARVAHIQGTGSYSDCTMLLIINNKYNSGPYGIARVSLRSNDQSSTTSGYTYCDADVNWLVRKGYTADQLQVGVVNAKGAWSADVFWNRGTGGWASATFTVIDGGARGSESARQWTLINSVERDNTTTTDKLTSSEVYTSIANYKTYSYVRTAADAGVTNSAIHANISTTTNAIAKYSDTVGTFANSGATIDANNLLTTASIKATNTFGIGNTSSTNGYGISLYNGPEAHEPQYGLMFAGTGTYGKYGYVQGDWATYLTMNGATNRGWIFRQYNSAAKASISSDGYATFPRISLNRVGGSAMGRLGYYNPTYYTWYSYMSNADAGTAPTGGQPSTSTEVTTWAIRSLIENAGGYGWIWEACTNAAAASTTTKPTMRMSLSSSTGRLRIAGNASTTTNATGQLIVSSAENGGFGNVAIELWRGDNASWQIANEGGVLYLRNNWTSAKQTTYTQTGLIMDYNTGAAAVNYLAIAKASLARDTSYRLYVNGTTYVNNLVTVDGTGASHRGVKVGNTYINAITGELIFQNNTAIRFGGDSWDYNVWAGLKYTHSAKTVYLGIADGTQFTANSAQSGGTLALPGIRYFSINGKTAIDAVDSWLRINEGKAFSSGVYFGSNIVRTDDQLQVGSSGSAFKAASNGTVTAAASITAGTSVTASNGSVWAQTTAAAERDIGVARNATYNAGSIYLYSSGSTTGNRGIYGTNNAGTGYSILTIDQSNKVQLNGNASTATSATSATNATNATNATQLTNNTRMDYGWSGLNYFNFSGTAGNGIKVNDSPTSAWWHIIRCNHANNAGYYTDLAIPFNDNSIYYKRIGNGALQNGGWVKVVDALNYTTVCDGRYVKKGGDTMTGQLYINYDQDVGLNQNGSLIIGNKAGANIGIDSNEIEARNNSGTATLYLQADGGTVSVGNYANTSYALSTSTFICNSWIRTKGQTGWYNEDYGGGMYMTDSTYVKVFNSKKLLAANEIISSAANGFRLSYGNYGVILRNDGSYFYFLVTNSGASLDGSWNSIRPFYFSLTNGYVYGTRLYNAVWNDYAEYRESTTTEPGRVVYELGNDNTAPTTKRLQHFAGVISDTFGYAEGETEHAKTPLAVAGRVLVYPYQNRDKYQPGDCVCAAPGGTVDIMTREEIINYPDRIVGTVSCVPTYETWGTGNVKVNGRIWIKVR